MCSPLWSAENSLLDVHKSIFSLSENQALRKESWSKSEEKEMWMTLGKNNTHPSTHVCLLNVFNYIYPTTLKKYHSDICLQSPNKIAKQCNIFFLTKFRNKKFSKSPVIFADFCIDTIFLPQTLVLKISRQRLLFCKRRGKHLLCTDGNFCLVFYFLPVKCVSADKEQTEIWFCYSARSQLESKACSGNLQNQCNP